MKQDYFQITVRKSVGLLIPILETVEVITCLRQEICSIPGVRFPLRGVLNQRGRLLWIVGLADLLEISAPDQKKRPQDQLTIVILTSQTEANVRLGCVVSKLEGIVSLSETAVAPLSKKTPFLRGVSTVESQKVGLLNVSSIFNYFQRSSISNYSMVSL